MDYFKQQQTPVDQFLTMVVAYSAIALLDSHAQESLFLDIFNVTSFTCYP